MNVEHFHRLKPRWRSAAYEWLIVAVLDRRDRGGRVVPCRCDEGAREIEDRHEGRRFRFDKEAA